VMVAPVEERDPHGPPGERASRSQPAEAATDDDNVGKRTRG
jgi:hypothetical protein